MVLRLKSVAVTAAVLTALVSVGACSSSSSSSSSAPASATASAPASAPAVSGTTATATAAAASGSPVTIGVVCSCSGPFGTTVSQAYTVVQDWAKSVNAAGGLNGHPVTLMEKDNGSVPGSALTDAQAVIAAKPAAIIDLDILDEVWQKAASSANIPVIGGNFSVEAYYTDPNWYPSGQTNDSITYSVAATAKKAGATNLADFYCAESAQCQASVPLIKAAGQSVGVPVVYSASISATAPNYTAQCLAAKQAGVKAIFIGDSIVVIDRVASDCNRRATTRFSSPRGPGSRTWRLTVPGLKNNLWSSYPVLPYFSSAPSITAMNAVLNKYSPGLTSNNNIWSEFAVQGWTAGLLLSQAVKNSGVTSSTAITPSLVTAGLDKVSNETLGGISPALTFTAGKPHPVDCWFTGRVQNGVASQVGGLTCQKSS